MLFNSKKFQSPSDLLGSISAALSCLAYPSREETAGHVSGKTCLWRQFLIKILAAWGDDSHWRSHMTPIARNIIFCTRAVFATSSFNFGLPTYFVSHCCGRRCFSKKVDQSCLTVVWQMTCQKSHIFFCAWCWHHIFVLLSSVALDQLKINFAWLCQRLMSLSFKKTAVHINLLECFFSWDQCLCYPSLCWLCSLSDILAPQDSNIYSHA